MSTTGNLCLDSIECLTHSIKEEDLKSLLSEFADAILKQHPEIKRVNLGAGGKTPKDLFPVIASISESMRQGHFYGDAKLQYCIAKQPSPFIESEQETWDAILSRYSNEFHECIDYIREYHINSTEALIALEELIQANPDLPKQLRIENFNRFLLFSKIPRLQNLMPIDIETLQQLPEHEKTNIPTARLVWSRSTPDELIPILPFVTEHERFAVIHVKNQYGDNLLHQVTQNPEFLKLILSLLTEEERLEGIESKNLYDNNVLHESIQNHESVNIILSFRPKKNQLHAVLKKDELKNTALHLAAKFPKSLKILLSLLSEQNELNNILEKNAYGNTVLLEAAKFTESLTCILSLISEDNLLTAIEEKNTSGEDILTQAIKLPESLQCILSPLPKKSRYEAIIKRRPFRNMLSLTIPYINSLKTILSRIPHLILRINTPVAVS